MDDLNIRRLCISKLTYSRHCSKCKYCVKAEWCQDNGVKFGVLDVYCCVNGGKFKPPICPNGIAYDVALGVKQEFVSADWKAERLYTTVNIPNILTKVEKKKKKEWQW